MSTSWERVDMSWKRLVLLAVMVLLSLTAGVWWLAENFGFDSLFEAYLATLLADVLIGLGIVAYFQQWWTRRERRTTMLALIRNELNFNEGVWVEWKKGLESKAIPIYLFRTAAWETCRDFYELVDVETAHAMGEVYDTIRALHFLAEAVLRLDTGAGVSYMIGQETRIRLLDVILSRGTDELEPQLKKAKSQIDQLMGQKTK